MIRVLMVDGEPNIRRLCAEELEEEGYLVRMASTGEEVVQLIDTFRPEVVILDVQLPDMSGLEAGRIIKGSNRTTRVIFHAFGTPPDRLEYWGGDAFVEKSFDLSELKNTVNSLSGLKEPWLLPLKELAPDLPPTPHRRSRKAGAYS
ncbi:MAG: response regulator [Deltaproteobacteria bacterium]|nr:response regulator [Deltaproteobacteria bacterium]